MMVNSKSNDSGKPGKVGDQWRTPQEVFDALNREFSFCVDMAATKRNSLCDTFFDEQNDSLGFDWAETINSMYLLSANKYVWCNPPYSNPMPWVKKAIEAQSNGLGVVMLLNNDVSVGWFAEALTTVSEIRHITGDKKENSNGYHSGRLAFLNHNGDPINGNNKPQFILVFNPFKIGARVTTYIHRSELYK